MQLKVLKIKTHVSYIWTGLGMIDIVYILDFFYFQLPTFQSFQLYKRGLWYSTYAKIFYLFLCAHKFTLWSIIFYLTWFNAICYRFSKMMIGQHRAVDFWANPTIFAAPVGRFSLLCHSVFVDYLENPLMDFNDICCSVLDEDSSAQWLKLF